MTAKSGARSVFLVVSIGVALAGCASSGPRFSGHGHYAIGRPHYTVAPYEVNGVWYYPRVDYAYDKTGTASWYGPGFNHRPTADGEIYDMNALSAAHKTLPLPSVVAVTNLANGRELRLRVNDRGPFVDGRVIDVSRRAAQLLGFERSGTAPVRVRVLKDASIRVAAAAMHGQFGEVGYAAAAPATRAEVAAAAPPSRPLRLAQAVPPSLRAEQVVMAPPSAAAAPLRLSAAQPPTEPVAAPASAAPPPRPTQPRHFWPSLIPQAEAAPLPSGFGLAVMRAARRTALRRPHRGGIFVQAGAFAEPENAKRVQARIAALGSVEIVSARVNGTALYRVRLGPVANAAEARRLLGRVAQRGYPGARLVEE
jgi:peptidoglycan lytic transglycosylase